MEIEKKSSNDLLEVILSGRFDNESSVYFRDSIEDSVRAGWHRILIDLGGVDYLSSAGIGALIFAKKKLESLNGQFGVHNATKNVVQILQVTRLYHLFVTDPTAFNAKSVSASFRSEAQTNRMVHRDGLDLTIYELPEGKPMRCSLFGHPGLLHNCDNRELVAHHVKFEKNSLGIGIGTISGGEAPGQVSHREILAVAGAVAHSAPTSGAIPDYSVSLGDFTPSAQLLYGLKLQGDFTHSIRFGFNEPMSIVNLSTLVPTLMEEAECQLAGVVMLADCAGLLGAQMRHFQVSDSQQDRFSMPQIRDWLSFCPEHSHQHKLALIVGIASLNHETLPSSLKGFLRPMSDDEHKTGHFHSAIFPYVPLKKKNIDLVAFVNNLFETSEIQDVLHLLRDSRTLSSQLETELRSGACWLAPIDPLTITEVQS